MTVFHRHYNVRSFLVCSFSRRPSMVLLSPPFPARRGPVEVDRPRAVVARTLIHVTVTACFSSSSNSAICLLRVRRSLDYIAMALLPTTTPDLISGTIRLLLLRSPRVPCCVSVCHKTKKMSFLLTGFDDVQPSRPSLAGFARTHTHTHLLNDHRPALTPFFVPFMITS